jgi:hypothetical protein
MNGVSLCAAHHRDAEMTLISPKQLREFAGIKGRILPGHLYSDVEYDKWGNICLANGTRLRGELFDDESVQKILKKGNVLGLFAKYVKYPRTYHVPFSPGLTKDDRVHKSLTQFSDLDVVVTMKMDGENTTMYNDHYHARSVDSNSDGSTQSWCRNLHASIRHDILDGYRVCGENIYAKHSILYKDLPSYFLVFSIWDDKNNCLSWDETVEWCDLIGLRTVPVLYRGIFDENLIKKLHVPVDPSTGQENEGWVLRVSRSFNYSEFRHVVGKYVRSGHVQTSHHWRREAVQPNQLASS